MGNSNLQLTLLISLHLVWNIECGSLDDVEHIVVFMQENRAFDHYYGSLQGVRGFNDRSAPLLPANGKNPFYQPVNGTVDDEAYLLPYPVMFNSTSATCMAAPAMDYFHDIGIWNNGKMDAWNTARSPGNGMAFFNRSDLPFYYALADNFLIGDNYFQSTFTATNPNRLHLFSGSNGLSVNSTFDILDDSEPPGINWLTFAETLQDAGITWRVYQEHDNFDDNGLAWFDQFKIAKPGNPLYDNGMVRVNNLYETFASDVRNNSLPQFSWVVGPSNLSEHARYHPQDGEDLSARLIKLFGEPDNADIYSKTVFILNYDEGGQFFDHLWSPTAPMNEYDGKSTVTIEGEITKKVNFGIPPGHPIGPAFRVPFFIISPWTRTTGGVVFSQLSDHTSVIRFVEQKFNVTCPNISPFRRAAMSDLLYAFDFDNPNYNFPVLPNTAQNTNASSYECENLPPPMLPTSQIFPQQETGTKISRHLPYSFNITDAVGSDTINITMMNNGLAGVVFHVFDYLNTTNAPKKYVIEAGKQLWDIWNITNGNQYNISLHGPNGFQRSFVSTLDNNNIKLVVILSEYEMDGNIGFNIFCSKECNILIVDKSYGKPEERLKLIGNQYHETKISLHSSGNWYDYKVQLIDNSIGNVEIERGFMGRMETGKDSITDPAMAIKRVHNIDDKINPSEYITNEDFENEQKRVISMCYKQDYLKTGFVKDLCWTK